MKKKATILIAILSLSMIFILLFCFQKESRKLENIYVNSTAQLYDLNAKQIKAELDLNVSSLDAYHVSFPILNISCERVMMFKIKEGQTKSVKAKVEKYLKELEKNTQLESEKLVLKNKCIYQKEEYYFVVISENAKSIMKEIKKKVY